MDGCPKLQNSNPFTNGQKGEKEETKTQRVQHWKDHELRKHKQEQENITRKRKEWKKKRGEKDRSKDKIKRPLYRLRPRASFPEQYS